MDTGGGEKCGGEQPAGGADLYAVLGLRKECSDADLKVAYRKLAMKWHPDRCSSSSSTKHMEEAKEKFQQIQGAYSGLNLPCLNLHPLPHIYVLAIHPHIARYMLQTQLTCRTDIASWLVNLSHGALVLRSHCCYCAVLSDANKRFLYDVGVYEEEEDEDSMQGMGDFLGEMAHMMSQTQPTRQESFEELQQLFVDMFQSDIDSGFCNGPAKDQYDPFQGQTQTSSTSPSSSPSPPPLLASEVEAASCNGINKRGSSAMGSGKPPRAGDAGAGHGQPEFCFGRQERFEELQQLFVDMFQSDIDSGFCNGHAKDQYDPFQGQTRTSSSPSPPPPLATEAEAPSCNGINKRGSSAMGSGKPPRAGDAGVGHGQPEFCFGQSDAKQAPKARGGNSSRRRNGQKQKLSWKHDVSSEDEMPSPQQHRVA